jgi:hypothetical protein
LVEEARVFGAVDENLRIYRIARVATVLPMFLLRFGNGEMRGFPRSPNFFTVQIEVRIVPFAFRANEILQLRFLPVTLRH